MDNTNRLEKITGCFIEQYPGEMSERLYTQLLVRATGRGISEGTKLIEKCKIDNYCWSEYYYYDRIRTHLKTDFNNKNILLISDSMEYRFIGLATHLQGGNVKAIYNTSYPHKESDLKNLNLPYEVTGWDIANKKEHNFPGWNSFKNSGKLDSYDAIQIHLVSGCDYYDPFLQIAKQWNTHPWDEYCEFINLVCSRNDGETLLILSKPHIGYYQKEVEHFENTYGRKMTSLEEKKFKVSEMENLLKPDAVTTNLLDKWSTIITQVKYIK